MAIKIEKVNEIDYKIIKTIPEIVIPQKVEETIVNLKETKEKLEKAISELDNRIQAKAGDEQRFIDAMAKHDAYIASQQAVVDSLTDEITQAELVGVKDVKTETIIN